MKNWYSFKNESAIPEISIYGDIGFFDIGAKEFISDLKALGKVPEIDLRINSRGGEIVEGNAIFNALKRNSAKINVFIDGIAASMASVIAMAGDNITMASNALIAIRNPFTGMSGESKDLRHTADLLDKMKSNIVNAYHDFTGIDESELSDMMDDETWFTAEEAIANGFATSAGEPIKAAALFDLKAFGKVPEGIENLLKNITGEGEDGTEETDDSESGEDESGGEGSESGADESGTDEESGEGSEGSDTLDISAELKARIDGAYEEGHDAGKALNVDKAFNEMKADYEGTITALNETHTALVLVKENEIKVLQDNLKDIGEQLNLSDDKLNVLVKGMDFEPEGSDKTSDSDDETFIKWKAIQDPGEATRFYEENKDAILAVDSKRNENK